MAQPRKPKASRVTPSKKSAVNVTSVTVEALSPDDLAPRQIDEIRKASGWKMGDLFEDNEPTGKMVAATMWLAAKEIRPDLKPQDFYDNSASKLGVEIVEADSGNSDGSLDPTNAAG